MSKKTQTNSLNQMNDFWMLAVDGSLKRPGFAVFHIVNNKIDSLQVSNVDNKTKKKTHGQIIDEIKFHLDNRVMPRINKETCVFVREHAAPNHYNETAVYEVVGLLNWYLYKLQAQQSEWIEYYPVTVKKTITDNGKAKKDEVAKCIVEYVGDLEYYCDDESDAVAIGLTHLIKTGVIKTKKGKKDNEDEEVDGESDG